MNSIEFFEHKNLAPRPAVDWGTGELQNAKIDPTIVKGPTYLLNKQPINQYYKESNLELSNVRMNDQLVPKALETDLLVQQIRKKFPMMHPLTSQTSYKRVFPNFTAPEDLHRGQTAVTAPLTYNDQTPAQVDKIEVKKKISGQPWRHEIRYQTQPGQANGLWYNDQELYHYPKPEREQQFYPGPPSLLVPNPRIRPKSEQLDARTANVLRNKERELMQTTHQIDYYKDGLGTRAPLNSDNLEEKMAKYQETGEMNDEMKPYFRRGAGISKFTVDLAEPQPPEPIVADPSHEKKILTKVEQDELLWENGRDYENYPEQNFENTPKAPTFQSLLRSNTMPNLNVNKPTPNRHPKSANKLSDEKQKMVQEHHERMQRMIYQNRKKEIDLIRPQEDIRLLRIKHAELENARGAKPNLKQNVKQHVNTLYDQESKYLGERAELYKTDIYNPYLLKQYVETVKVDPAQKPVAYMSNGVGCASQREVYVTPQDPPMNTRPHRPTLFADQVFHDYNELKRAPLESVLTNPNLSAHPKVQENGYYHQQTTYGGSYNTKKFLQENELLSNPETFYQRLHEDEIEGQNVVLKSSAQQIALANYKNGLTDSPSDMNLANQMLDKYAKDTKEIEYPRVKGPIPPEPYEKIYCAKEITEHSDGNSKRYYTRVYDSPYEPTHARFEVYKPDVEAIEAYNQKIKEEQEGREKQRRKLEEEYSKNLPRGEFSLSASQDKVARRELDRAAKLTEDQNKMKSVYSTSYTPYHYENTVKCPPNQFYKGIEYTQDPSGHARLNNESVPDHLIGLQDGWSKSTGNRRFHSAYETRSPDLRQDVQEGKRIVKEAPANAYKYV